jgi:hypothetical protein
MIPQNHPLDSLKTLFFYGYLRFRDSFKREYRYFWRYRYAGGRFVLDFEHEQKVKD